MCPFQDTALETGRNFSCVRTGEVSVLQRAGTNPGVVGVRGRGRGGSISPRAEGWGCGPGASAVPGAPLGSQGHGAAGAPDKSQPGSCTHAAMLPGRREPAQGRGKPATQIAAGRWPLWGCGLLRGLRAGGSLQAGGCREALASPCTLLHGQSGVRSSCMSTLSWQPPQHPHPAPHRAPQPLSHEHPGGAAGRGAGRAVPS